MWKRILVLALVTGFIVGMFTGCKNTDNQTTASQQLIAKGLISQWQLNEISGQPLKNSVPGKTDGWLGDSQGKDDFDPFRINDDNHQTLYFNGNSSAIIPDGSYDTIPSSKGFSVQLWFKPLMLSNRRTQLLTKGCDSSSFNWQILIGYNAREQKQRLTFVMRGRKHSTSYKVSTPIKDITDQWNRMTVTGDGKKLNLYLNGELKASSPYQLIRKNKSPLTIGTYPLGHKFCFNGFIKDIAFYNRKIVPQKLKAVPPAKYLLDCNFLNQNATEKWRPINGKWIWDKKGYCEFSDKETPKGIWAVTGNREWRNYCFQTKIDFADNVGSTLLAVGWQDINNTYLLEHTRFSSGMVGLYLFKVKDGCKTLMAKLDSAETQLPIPKKGTPLTYKLYFFTDIISIMVDNKFYISVKDSTFQSGQVAIGESQRKIIVKNAQVKVLDSFVPPIKVKQILPVIISITNPAFRHAFYRGEKITFDLKVLNNTQKDLEDVVLDLNINNNINEQNKLKLGTIQPGKELKKSVVLDTTSWKSGKYCLTVTMAGTEYIRKYDLFIASELKPNSYRFYSWGGRTDEPFLQSLQEHGFNGSSMTLSADPKQRQYFAQACDNAVKNGQNVKLHYNCLWSIAPGKDTRNVRYDGSHSHYPNPSHPDQREWALGAMRKLANIVKSYPVITDVLLNSENENHAEPSYDPASKARAKQELGFEMPSPSNAAMEKDGTAGRVVQVPKQIKAKTPAVFPDDNKWYRFFKWFWQKGCGDNTLNYELSEIIKEQRPDIKTTHDPFRDVPLFFRNKGLDEVGTWFYCHPDSSETLGAAETLIRAGQDEEKPKGMNFGASLWLYANRICPAKQRQAGVQPTDIIIEADWLAFSRIPTVIEHYSLAFLIPPGNQLEYLPKDMYSKLAKFSKKILQPFWPTVSRLERTPRKCAMLISYGSQLFGPRIWSGYGCSTGFGYYAALQMAHIPTDIIFDENIQRGDLTKYKVLFMHNTTHLPQSVYDKIVKFAKNGGTVVCGEPFAKMIPGAVNFDMDMSKRKKSAYHNIKRKTGYTADIVYDQMLKEAAKVRKLVIDKVKPYADCDSPMTFLNLLNYGDVKYLFVINDKRTFGDYAGKKYKAVMEKGLPQTVTVKLLQKNCTVYDLGAHKKLDTDQQGDFTSVKLDLPAAWGKILAISPEPIASVGITSPATFTAGEKCFFTVKVLNEKNQPLPGIQPLKVSITDPQNKENEFSGYFAAINGIVKITFIPAVNDAHGEWKIRITELSSGLTASHSWNY